MGGLGSLRPTPVSVLWVIIRIRVTDFAEQQLESGDLRACRRALKLSLLELGRVTGLAASRLSVLERGRDQPSDFERLCLEGVLGLGVVFGVPPLGGVGALTFRGAEPQSVGAWVRLRELLEG